MSALQAFFIGVLVGAFAGVLFTLGLAVQLLLAAVRRFIEVGERARKVADVVEVSKP